jgi:hypothetical protein
MGLSATIKAAIAYKVRGTPDLGATESQYAGHANVDWMNGTGDFQASKVFSDTRQLAASTSEDLDLAGSLAGPLGAAVVFATVKAILVKAAAGNTNNVVVGGASANQFVGPFGDAADTIAVKPGGTLLLTAPKTGWTVGAGTADLLKIGNSGAGSVVNYDIVILGT